MASEHLLNADQEGPGVNYCSICFEVFDDQSRIPKILHCGHTFCSVCISNIVMVIDAKCPDCRTMIRPFEFPPTNFSILRSIENENFDSKIMCCNIEAQIEENFSQIQAKLNELQFTKLETHKKSLEHLKRENESGDKTLTRQKFIRKETDLLLAEIKSLLNSLCNATKPRGQIKNYTDNLEKVTKRILEGDPKLFTYLDLEGRRLYGRISEGEQGLHCHSLAPYTNDMGEISNNIIPLAFMQDFEKPNRTVFLDFSCGSKVTRIYIQLWDDTIYAKSVYLLCTGERGASYKGSRYTLDDDQIKIEEHVSDGLRSAEDILPNLEEECINDPTSTRHKGWVYRCPMPGRGGAINIIQNDTNKVVKGNCAEVHSASKGRLEKINEPGNIVRCGIVVSTP